MGAQVTGRAFAQGCAADRPAAISSLSGLSLKDPQQILRVSKLSPEETHKNYKHLCKVNDQPVGGSFHLK